MSGGSPESRGRDWVRGFVAPPIGFDAISAPADVLSRHGVPRRPDPTDEPYLAERWADVFGQPLSIVAAELAIDPVNQPPPSAGAQNFNVDGWAGVGRVIAPVVTRSETVNGGVLNGGYELPATFVVAEWEVPQVMGDPRNLDEFLSIWVGLDGFPAGDLSLVVEPPWSQILRAGVRTTPSGGGFQWLAWTEWYSSDQTGLRATVTNFPVQSGDTVGIVVCVTQPRAATIFLANLSLNHGTSVEVSAPTQIVRSTGTTVEWIVEGGDPSVSLPFSPVTFQGCVAGSSREVFHLTPGDMLTNMFEVEDLSGRGPDVTSTIVTSPTTAVVEWIGAPEEFSE
jgi:Peptidase A4 family